MKIIHTLTHTPAADYEHYIDRPDCDVHTVLAELANDHPTATSIVLTFVKIGGSNVRQEDTDDS